MPDKKLTEPVGNSNRLTDTEIKKALEICASEHLGCEDGCPLKGMNCRFEMPKLALAQINRQTTRLKKVEHQLDDALKMGEVINAEYKKLQDEYRWLDQESDILRADVENLNRICDEVNVENESLKAEVERLKNAYKQCAWERDIFAEDMTQEIKKDCSYLMLDIKTIKAEAYREFAERLKEKGNRSLGDCFIVGWIDNLLNELVGDENGKDG